MAARTLATTVIEDFDNDLAAGLTGRVIRHGDRQRPVPAIAHRLIMT